MNLEVFDFICISVCVGMAPKDMQLILTRLASIEAQLMNLTKMVQCLVNSGTGSSAGSHELPDGVVWPLDSVEHLRLLEETVQDKQTKKAMVMDICC